MLDERLSLSMSPGAAAPPGGAGAVGVPGGAGEDGGVLRVPSGESPRLSGVGTTGGGGAGGRSLSFGVALMLASRCWKEPAWDGGETPLSGNGVRGGRCGKGLKPPGGPQPPTAAAAASAAGEYNAARDGSAGGPDKRAIWRWFSYDFSSKSGINMKFVHAWDFGKMSTSHLFGAPLLSWMAIKLERVTRHNFASKYPKRASQDCLGVLWSPTLIPHQSRTNKRIVRTCVRVLCGGVREPCSEAGEAGQRRRGDRAVRWVRVRLRSHLLLLPPLGSPILKPHLQGKERHDWNFFNIVARVEPRSTYSHDNLSGICGEISWDPSVLDSWGMMWEYNHQAEFFEFAFVMTSLDQLKLAAPLEECKMGAALSLCCVYAPVVTLQNLQVEWNRYPHSVRQASRYGARFLSWSMNLPTNWGACIAHSTRPKIHTLSAVHLNSPNYSVNIICNYRSVSFIGGQCRF